MSLRALIVFVIGFAVGIGIESVTDQNQYTVVWLLSLALVVGLMWRRASTTCPAPHLLLVTLLLFSAALGIFRTQIYETQFSNSLDSELNSKISFSGEVIREPDMRERGQMLYVEYQDTIILVSAERSLDVSYGDTVLVEGKLEKPENFQTDLGREFNYVGYLEAKRVEYRISFAEVEIESEAESSLIGTLLMVKQSFMAKLDQIFAEPQGSLADGLLLGLNQGLGDKLEDDFRRAGIIHIVVLSGYNIMLVVAFVMFVLSFFMRQRLKLIFGLVAITAFAFIVGLSATVVRASIMAGLLLIAQTFNRSYDVLRALLFAGFLMLLINPYLLVFDIGFQLSFMATLGIILALPYFSSNENVELLSSVRGYVVATVATQIAVLPLLIYQIGEVSLVAVAVNVLVLPVVPLAMLGSFLAGTISYLLSPLGLLFGYVTQLFLSYIIVVAEWFSSLPFATVSFDAVSPWVLLIMYGVLGYGYWWLAFRTKHEDPMSDWTIEEEEVVKRKTGAGLRPAPVEESLPKMFR